MTETPWQIIARTEARLPPGRELDRLKRRRWVLELVPKGGVGMEVGVFRGHFGALICDRGAAKLYMVDLDDDRPDLRLGQGIYQFRHADDQRRRGPRGALPGRAVPIEATYPRCADRSPIRWTGPIWMRSPVPEHAERIAGADRQVTAGA